MPYFFNPLNFSVLPSSPNTESLWCKVQLENMSLIIGVVYHLPGSNIEHLHNLDKFLHTYNTSSSKVIFMGNFNALGVDWSSMTASGHEVAIRSKLIHISLSCGRHQIVQDFTCQAVVLDFVFSSSSLINTTYECDIIDGISDHKGVFSSGHRTKILLYLLHVSRLQVC